jgi:ankyrin repeat protein
MTAVMKAVRHNDAAALDALIAGGADVNELDPNGDAPLVMAAYLGHAGIVRRLLDAGADLTAVDPGMRATALHAAAYAGRTEAARILIERGIDIDKQGPVNGYTALHDAIWQNNVDTAEAIIEGGANLGVKNHDGQTPLDFAKAKKRKEIVTMIERAARG